MVYQERQKQLESEELAKAKKLLEEKRNFVSKDAGSFKKALSEHESNYKAMKKDVDQVIAAKKAEKDSYMKNFLGSLKHKPKKSDLINYQNAELSANANSVDGSKQTKDSPINALVPLRYNEDVNQKAIAKKKLAKMAAYQKSIHELYMPKPSEKKKNEREQIQRRLKTNPRETKPYEDYLSALKDMNKQDGAASPAVKRLPSVGSLPNLESSKVAPLGGTPNHLRNGR